MKQFIIVIILILNSFVLFAQNAKTYIYQGNQLYEQNKFKEAEANYRKAAAKKDQRVIGNFNLGDALYKQKKFDNAAKNFTDIASTSAAPTVKARAYHNLGNSMLETKKYEESIDAYKKSLLNNPKDDATRYNLAYAQEMLKKQQQQNKDQNKNDKNNQDKKNKDKNSKNNQDKKNGDKNDQNKNPNQQNKQDQKDQQKQQDKNSISKDDAQRMLDALNNQEQGTQEKLKNKKLKGGQAQIAKDW